MTSQLRDETGTFASAKAQVAAFCAARDWDQFHGAKDLAIGVVTEGAELLEHFRFKSLDEITAMLSDETKREAIGFELADVLFFVLRFSQRFGFDLTSVLAAKMARNAAHYPVEKAKGSNRKYDEL